MCYVAPAVRQVIGRFVTCIACCPSDVGALLMEFPSIVYPSVRKDQPFQHSGTEKLVPDIGKCFVGSERG